MFRKKISKTHLKFFIRSMFLIQRQPNDEFLTSKVSGACWLSRYSTYFLYIICSIISAWYKSAWDRIFELFSNLAPQKRHLNFIFSEILKLSYNVLAKRLNFENAHFFNSKIILMRHFQWKIHVWIHLVLTVLSCIQEKWSLFLSQADLNRNSRCLLLIWGFM